MKYMYKVFPRKKEKPDHRLFSVPVREIPGVELYLKQKLKLNINKNILLVKLKAAFTIIKIISNLIHTALIHTKVFKRHKPHLHYRKNRQGKDENRQG